MGQHPEGRDWPLHPEQSPISDEELHSVASSIGVFKTITPDTYIYKLVRQIIEQNGSLVSNVRYDSLAKHESKLAGLKKACDIRNRMMKSRYGMLFNTGGVRHFDDGGAFDMKWNSVVYERAVIDPELLPSRSRLKKIMARIKDKHVQRALADYNDWYYNRGSFSGGTGMKLEMCYEGGLIDPDVYQFLTKSREAGKTIITNNEPLISDELFQIERGTSLTDTIWIDVWAIGS